MPSFPVLRSLEVFSFVAVHDRRKTKSSVSALVSQSQPFRIYFCGKLKDQRMTKLRLLSLALASISLVSTGNASTFADGVISYNSGTGFASGFTNASVSLGSGTA